MAYRVPPRFDSTTKLDRSTLLTHESTATEIILSKLLEYYGDGLLRWRALQSLLSGILQSIRSLILRNPTNRVRVHVDFHYYHVYDGFLMGNSNYGMKPASKSATMEMLKKVDKNHLCDDDERCTVCLEELGREEDEEVLCMPCLHSDSFDSSDDDDGNCVDTCENNSFNSNDNDGLESFTFDDNSLINEHVGELHDMLCDVDDELNVDASLLDLNDIEFDTFHDNCLDDAIYIHDLLGEEKEETDGDLKDVLLSSEKEEVEESVTIEKENEEENFENKNVLFEEVHCKIIEEKKTRNESVREKVEEKWMTSVPITYPTWGTKILKDTLEGMSDILQVDARGAKFRRII
nr:E3 ubiquitin-protein ligase CIP8-like [Ipomoea batatas]